VIVCADASPIIHLSRVDLLLALPKLFDRVLVPSAVFDEVVTAGLERFGSAELQAASWG
jgi:predicted nucleic acid-binding protein